MLRVLFRRTFFPRGESRLATVRVRGPPVLRAGGKLFRFR
jgi:hypothetical protein